MDLENCKVVRHAVGTRGWVLNEVDGERPAYRVLTEKGQRIWWRKDRCTVLDADALRPPNIVRLETPN